MAFINDYLTEEEKARFEGYNIMYPRESVHAGLKLGVGKGKRKCTLDRERNIYLFHTQNTRDRFDYEEYIDYFTLVVLKNGVSNVAYINLEQKSGILKEDKDYDYLWICKGWNMENVKNFSKEELFKYLKEALISYGCCGRVNNLKYVVKFDF